MSDVLFCAVFPFPPSVNNYLKQARNGRRYISENVQQFRKDVAAVVEANGIASPLECKLDMRIDFHEPNRRKRDVDNPLKPLLDAMELAGVYVDDCQVMRIDVMKIERDEPMNADFSDDYKGQAVVEIKAWEETTPTN